MEQINPANTNGSEKNLRIRISDMKKVTFHISEQRMDCSLTRNKGLPFGKE